MRRDVASLVVCMSVVFLFGMMYVGTAVSEDPVEVNLLEVKESALCENVEDRQPVDSKTTFSKDVGHVYFWTNVYGAKEPTQIKHVWYYNGQAMVEIPLSVTFSRHRTWSSKTIMPQWVGDWSVEVVDVDGNVLKKDSFVIESGMSTDKEVVEETSSKDVPKTTVVKETQTKIEMKLGTDIQDREVVGEANNFASSVGRIYCWNLIEGEGYPQNIQHVWYYGKEKMAEIDLEIKSSKYRTWSYKTILPQWIGNWSVEVVDANGDVLEKSSFILSAE